MEKVPIENSFPGCLAHASCLVGWEGIAAVIDPRRDVDIYLDAARHAVLGGARSGLPHIALSGQYASWTARLPGLGRRIIPVGEDADHLRESRLRLARVGVENAREYLEDGVAGWVQAGYELDYIPQIGAHEFKDLPDREKGPYGSARCARAGRSAGGGAQEFRAARDSATSPISPADSTRGRPSRPWARCEHSLVFFILEFMLKAV